MDRRFEPKKKNFFQFRCSFGGSRTSPWNTPEHAVSKAVYRTPKTPSQVNFISSFAGKLFSTVGVRTAAEDHRAANDISRVSLPSRESQRVMGRDGGRISVEDDLPPEYDLEVLRKSCHFRRARGFRRTRRFRRANRG